jgi:hypothetical protein
VHVFPRDANPTTSPTPPDSTLGAWIDPRGVVRLVTSPMRERSVSFARAIGGPRGAFHVVFATGVDSAHIRRLPSDTATLWYARYANGTWRDLQRLTETQGVGFDTEFTSELLRRGDELSFVFPFLDDPDRDSTGGLIALRRRNGRWSADTLRTWRAPTAVRARLAPDGGVVVLLVQLEPGAGVENVFLTRLNRRWETPRRIGGSASRPVSDVELVLLPNGPAASWATWRWLNSRTNVVEWAPVRPGAGTVDPATVIDSGAATYPFEFLAAGSRLFWLYHGEPFDSVVRFVVAAESRVSRGNLVMPFHNARAEAVAVGNDRFVVFTMKRGRAEREPMMASWKTVVRIRCPSSARR